MNKYLGISIICFFLFIIRDQNSTAVVTSSSPYNDIDNTKINDHPTASPPVTNTLQIEPNGDVHNIRGDAFEALRSLTNTGGGDVTTLSSSSVATHSNKESSSSSSSSSFSTDKVTLFEPEDDWKEILPGQSIPGVSIYANNTV